MTAASNERTPLLANVGNKPKDRWKIVGVAFMYLGMSTMVPWNFLVAVTAFWNFKFRNVSMDYQGALNNTWEPERGAMVPTQIQLAFPSYLAIASNVPGAMTTLVHSFCGQRIGVSTRIFWALSILFSSFVALLALSIPDSDAWQENFLHVVLLLVVLTNVGVNVLQGALFGVSGRFPPSYAGYVMTGQAMGGVLPAVVAIALVTLDVQPRLLGPACFVAILAFIFVAFTLFYFISKNTFFRYYAEGKQGRPCEIPSVDQGVEEVDRISYKAIFRKSWTYFLVGYINYATTLTVFPAITSLVESQTRTRWTSLYFTPVFSVLLYNVGDLVGRSTATWLKWPGRKAKERYALLVVTILRIGLIPFFMLCNASPESRTLPVIVDSDIAFALMVAVLGLSVGYIGNICLTEAPKTSDDPPSQEATSLALTAFFVSAQASGSTLGYIAVNNI